MFTEVEISFLNEQEYISNWTNDQSDMSANFVYNYTMVENLVWANWVPFPSNFVEKWLMNQKVSLRQY